MTRYSSGGTKRQCFHRSEEQGESSRIPRMVFHVKLWHLLAAALLLAEMVTQTLRNLLYLHKDCQRQAGNAEDRNQLRQQMARSRGL